MIAFTIFWRPIYRYGLAYAVTFLWGYLRLQRVSKQSFLDTSPKIQHYLQTSLDDFVSLIIVAILLGGRFGHVFFYEWHYYSKHLSEIVMINQWGMSFLGGVIGVVAMLFFICWRKRFTWWDMRVLGDLILCIVPLGIFLGRISNFLNQEMIGKAIGSFPYWFQTIAEFLWLVHVYTRVDMIPRFNVNIAQAVLEGGVLLIVGQILFMNIYNKNYEFKITNYGFWNPWTIVSFFFIRYGMVRFLLEYGKDLPSYEYVWLLSVSQRLSIVLVFFGILLCKR
jgi:phosphatidylglycerol---prolipoprotein diacylglyceryl transferase